MNKMLGLVSHIGENLKNSSQVFKLIKNVKKFKFDSGLINTLPIYDENHDSVRSTAYFNHTINDSGIFKVRLLAVRYENIINISLFAQTDSDNGRLNMYANDLYKNIEGKANFYFHHVRNAEPLINYAYSWFLNILMNKLGIEHTSTDAKAKLGEYMTDEYSIMGFSFNTDTMEMSPLIGTEYFVTEAYNTEPSIIHERFISESIEVIDYSKIKFEEAIHQEANKENEIPVGVNNEEIQ